ncbi:MAG: hypothetical protein WA269_03970 [Candidatus Udaeobacter sp.]
MHALMGKGRNAGEGAAGLSKERRKDVRQEVRGKEWSEGDERHGRLSREVAVEHRGSVIRRLDLGEWSVWDTRHRR